MDIIEALKLIITTICEFASALFKAIFTVKDSVDSFKDVMTAAVFGVPVWVVTAVGTVVLIANIAVKAYSWVSDRL